MPQQFPQGPAMVSDVGSHCRSAPHSLLREQALMIRAEVVDTIHQIHACTQTILSARQIAGAPAKNSQPASESGVQPLNERGVEYAPALRLLNQSGKLLLLALRQPSTYFQAHSFAPLPQILLDHLTYDHA